MREASCLDLNGLNTFLNSFSKFLCHYNQIIIVYSNHTVGAKNIQSYKKIKDEDMLYWVLLEIPSCSSP